MVRTLIRQSQIYPTDGDLVGYYDDLSVQLVAANGPETVTGTALIAGESITFSAAASTVTLVATNPQTSGVVPGDDITISGSTSDDGTYEIVSVTASAVVVDHTFTAADGGGASGNFDAVRNAMTDMNFLRAQLRKIVNDNDWFDPPTAANSPVLQDKKIVYQVETTTDFAVPAGATIDVSSLGLTYADQSGTAEGSLAETSAPSAGGARKSEGKHWVEIVDAATGAPITVSGNKVYGYLVVDNIATPTSELVYFVYFNNSTDAEVLITNLSTQQDGSATNVEVIYNERANLSNVPEDFGLDPRYIEAAISSITTLQQAYNAGQTIGLADAQGDLVITLDDAGSAADFAVTDGGGDYIRTDAANNTLDLGSAANQVDVNASFQVTGANTFDVGSGQSTMDGNVDIGSGLDVTGITNLGDGGTTNYLQASATGDLDFIGTADTINKSDGTLTVQATSDNLTLQTVTSGQLSVDSAGLLAMEGDGGVTIDALSSSGFSIDGTAVSNMSVTGGNLSINTVTSGNLILASAAELTFDDQHWAGTTDPLPFADASNTAFTGAATGATSLIDAINNLAAVSGESFDQADTVPGLTARDTDVTIPGGLTYTAAADFVSDFIIFVNGVKMRNGLNAAANYDVYPGSSTSTIRFEFKLKAADVVSAVKIA